MPIYFDALHSHYFEPFTFLTEHLQLAKAENIHIVLVKAPENAGRKELTVMMLIIHYQKNRVKFFIYSSCFADQCWSSAID